MRRRWTMATWLIHPSQKQKRTVPWIQYMTTCHTSEAVLGMSAATTVKLFYASGELICIAGAGWLPQFSQWVCTLLSSLGSWKLAMAATMKIGISDRWAFWMMVKCFVYSSHYVLSVCCAGVGSFREGCLGSSECWVSMPISHLPNHHNSKPLNNFGGNYSTCMH